MATHIDELRELTRKLTGLLEDPQPGLFCWRDQLENVIAEISAYSAFPIPVKEIPGGGQQ